MLLLEVLAASTGPVVMSYDAWAAELYSDDEVVREFINFCADQSLLAVEDDGETLSVFSSALERVTPAQAAPAPGDETLFTRHEQWAAWFVDDLNYPPDMANSRDSMRYFARWCASRVTVGDMSEAVQAAISDGSGVGVSALHKHLQALRAKRIKEANECF